MSSAPKGAFIVFFLAIACEELLAVRVAEALSAQPSCGAPQPMQRSWVSSAQPA